MTWFFWSLIALFGLIWGSFLNAWVWRTRERLPLGNARSMCPYCRKMIAWYDNIPLVSYLLLRGRCRACHKPISLEYPIVESAVMVLTLGVVWLHGGPLAFSPEMVRDWIILYFLLFTFLYDLKCREILDLPTIYAGMLLLATSIIFGWQPWHVMLVGAGLGSGFFLAQYVVSKGRWIGGGDIRLGFFMGVILGWPVILVALFLAYVSGAAVSLVMLALKKQRLASETPFGTYLAGATVISMFWGTDILRWYLGIVGW